MIEPISCLDTTSVFLEYDLTIYQALQLIDDGAKRVGLTQARVTGLTFVPCKPGPTRINIGVQQSTVNGIYTQNI